MFGWDDALAEVLKIANKFVKDPEAQAQLALETARLKQQDEFKAIDTALQMAQMQADVNKVEAASPNIFTSGWRPHIGWVCGFSLGANYIYFPLLEWIAALAGHAVQMPPIDSVELLTLVAGMLGLSKMRSDDKRNGVAS